jgi:hypothetical protein
MLGRTEDFAERKRQWDQAAGHKAPDAVWNCAPGFLLSRADSYILSMWHGGYSYTYADQI